MLYKYSFYKNRTTDRLIYGNDLLLVLNYNWFITHYFTLVHKFIFYRLCAMFRRSGVKPENFRQRLVSILQAIATQLLLAGLFEAVQLFRGKHRGIQKAKR